MATKVGEWALDYKTLPMPAAADLSAKAFLAIKMDSNGKAALAGAGEAAIGPLMNADDVTAAGETASVAWCGIAWIEVDGTTPIAPMDKLTPDANNRWIKTTTSTDFVSAIALGSCSVQGGRIPALLVPPHRY